jgi:hypothetical protein
MPIRFGIDHDMEDAELNRREAYERQIFRRAPACLLNAGRIDGVLQSEGFFCIWNHLDATLEYAVNASVKRTLVYIQRDWSKAGLLHTPYRMCITEPGIGKFYFRVRSVAQVKRALVRWRTRVQAVTRAKMMKKE